MRDQDSVAVCELRELAAEIRLTLGRGSTVNTRRRWASDLDQVIAALQSQQDGAQGGEDGPDVFDCSHAAAVRACGCGFCVCLTRPAIAPQATPAAVDWPTGVLSRDKTLEIVRDHNAWRRGAKAEQTDARMVGLALDAVVAALAAPPAEVKP